MTYVKQTWVNGVVGGTPISAARLNHIESGIETVSEDLIEHTPESVGAIGDGVIDDTVALNTLFALPNPKQVRFLAGKNYRVTGHLFIPGRQDIIFEPGASITLDGDLTLLSQGDKFFINLGIASKGASADPWTGQWSGGTIYATNAARVQRMIQVHAGRDYYLTDIVIDVRANGDRHSSGIAGYNDAAWCPNPIRERAHIDRVHVLGSQSTEGGEGIGHGTTSYLWVRDCYVSGMADDPLGIHSCNHVIVSGFQGRTTDGRIYLSNTLDFNISNFYVERIAKVTDGAFIGGGGLLEMTIEDISGPTCSRGRISNGEMVLPNGIPSATYMIRARGIRNVDISDIQFNCGTINASNAVSLESITNVGWSDPEGLDASTKARVRNVTLSNLHTIGTVDVGVGQVGSADDFVSPVTVDGSVLGPSLYFTDGAVWTRSNRVKSGLAADLVNISGITVTDPILLFEGPISCVDTAVTKAARTTGLDRYYVTRTGRVMSFRIEFAANMTAGDLFFGISKNGGAIIENIQNTTANPRGLTAYTYQIVGYNFVAGDYLEFRVQPFGLTPTPLQAWVQVYGLYA